MGVWEVGPLLPYSHTPIPPIPPYFSATVSPDTRKHRGAHPEDHRLFAPEQVPILRAATAELSWLLSRGYPVAAALKLVGDRHRLHERQRTAVSRAACSDANQQARQSRRVQPEGVRGQALVVDGFNLIVTVEAALSGGVLLRCRDGTIRDLSSVHGSYRSVQETDAALRLIGETLAGLAPVEVLWLLDSPVSNSGRLAGSIRAAAAENGWPWTVGLVFNPDAEIIRDSRVAVTSDSVILDGAARWLNLGAHLVRSSIRDAWMVDLAGEG